MDACGNFCTQLFPQYVLRTPLLTPLCGFKLAETLKGSGQFYSTWADAASPTRADCDKALP